MAAFAQALMDADLLDQAHLRSIDEEVEAEIEDAVQFADASPEPDPDRLFEYSYATPVANQPSALPGRGPVALITYRQALHDTLREEMHRDETVVLMGEEIGVFEGSYKITAGLLKEFGPKRVIDTPIDEEGFVGAAVGAAMLGLRPVVEIMTVNFSLLAHGPDRQPRRQDPLHVRRSGACADGPPHPRGWRPAARRHALAELLRLVRLHPGLEGRRAGYAKPTRAACSSLRSATTIRSSFSRTWRSTTPGARSPDSATKPRMATTTAGPTTT